MHRGGFGPTVPLGSQVSFQINLDGDGLQVVTLPPAAGTATVLADVAAAIQTAVRALTSKKARHRSRRIHRLHLHRRHRRRAVRGWS